MMFRNFGTAAAFDGYQSTFQKGRQEWDARFSPIPPLSASAFAPMLSCAGDLAQEASSIEKTENAKEYEMLWNASNIKGYAILASDGAIGSVSDFLFDDTSWLVRWLVVDTGYWLSGHRVLLPSSAMAHIDTDQERCSINLTKQQIENSPDVDTERSVTRQMEDDIYGHYGYTPFWDSGYGYMGGLGYLGGMGGAIPMTPESRREQKTRDAERNHGDVHLRSATAVTGYHILASDGQIGHVEDYLMEDADWSIQYLVIDTKNWWPGKKVLISPRSVTGINWIERLVNVDVNRQKIEDAPAYEDSTLVDQAYEEKFRAYYHIDQGES